MDQGPLKWTQINVGGGVQIKKSVIHFFFWVHIPATSETKQDQERGMIGTASLLHS